MSEMAERTKRWLRIVNVVVWLAVWAGAVAWSGTYGAWFIMFMQAFIPVMLGGSIHIALRPGGSES
jgi:hypothetical protein